MAEKPSGAVIVSKEDKNEAGAKLKEVKKQNSFEEFIAVQKKAEEESLKPLSDDLEVVQNVNQKDLMAFQGRFENGKLNPNGQHRLRGWDGRTRTALVLKVAFLDKKAKIKKEK